MWGYDIQTHLILSKCISNGIPKALLHILINQLSVRYHTNKEYLSKTHTSVLLRDKHITQISTIQTALKLCVELNDEI